MYDVVVIGAGVIGSAIARELSRYEMNICVLEKHSDVCCGTSKANSGIVHAGFDAKTGSLKAKLNVLGNSMYDEYSKELDFPFERNGSLVLCFSKDDIHVLEELKKQGERNGVPELKIIYAQELREKEPNISDTVVAALVAPTGGIVDPFKMTIALAENANVNGVEFKFNSKVESIEKIDDNYKIITKDAIYESKIVINATGVYSDYFNNMISEKKLKVTARRGEYCLFDKIAGNVVSHTIFQLPSKLGKGILVTKTIDGNLLVGPNAVDSEDKDDVRTTREGLEDIMFKATKSINNIPKNAVITSFTGLRAVEEHDDFVIGEADDSKGFINVAGIQSPGLSSAPAIGLLVKDIVVDRLNPNEKADFNGKRKDIVKFSELSNEERNKLIKNRPEYGNIICRCELVTEGEIIDAIRRPLGATNLDGIKRRTRAGAGRCQAGFCTSRTVEILSRELNIPQKDVTKFGEDSYILVGKNKENI
jgi:glycerol-3-phosphate dehydrogenase